MNNLVSIIMPLYNSSYYIKETIKSIITQTYSNWELLITDDCSTDDSCDIVNSLKINNKIHLFKLTKNSGAAICRNNSLKYAKGRYIAFCDSDDIWRPHKLMEQIKFLNTNNIPFTFSSYNRILNNNLINTVIPPADLTYNKLLKYCPIGTSTVIYDTIYISKIDFPEFRYRQDYALWLSIFKNINKTLSMREPLVDYIIRENSLSSNKFRAAYYHLYVLRKVTNLNYITLLYNFIFYSTRGLFIHYIEIIFKKKIYEKHIN